MEINVGPTDRLVRLLVGTLVGLVGLAALADVLGVGPAVGAVALVVGLILVGTAITRTCLAYSVLGVDTCGRRT